MKTKMKIHDMPGFVHPFRVRVALAEKRLGGQVEFIKVDVIAAEQEQPAFLAMNPTATVPVLELADGTLISESTAITEYLDHLDGDPTLTGKTAKEKGVIMMMQKRAESELLDAIGYYFHLGTPGLGPVEQVYEYPDFKGRNEWANIQREKGLAGLKYFDSVLQKQPYIAGDTFSMADISVLAGFIFMQFANLTVPTELKALLAWHARMQERPSVKHPTEWKMYGSL